MADLPFYGVHESISCLQRAFKPPFHLTKTISVHYLWYFPVSQKCEYRSLSKTCKNRERAMYEKVNPFDTNNKERIYNLLRLKGESLIKGHTLALKRNTDASGHYSNFFSAISDQIDLLLIYFLNDEISASLHERGPIKELIKEILEDHYSKSDLKELQVAQDDLFDLFVNRTDFIIGSNFLDFKISTYSTFEKYVVELYETQILKTARSNKKKKI